MVALFGVLSVAAAACGGDDDSASPATAVTIADAPDVASETTTAASVADEGVTETTEGVTETTAGELPGVEVSDEVESLTVAIPTAGQATSGDVAIAQTQGFFEARGLDVTIMDGLGSNVANVVASGQADLGYAAAAGPLSIARNGADTVIVRAVHGGGIAANLAAGTDIETIDDLRAIDGCTIGSLPAPSLTFGAANLIIEALGLDNCSLQIFPDPPSEAGALVAGNVDAAVSSFSVFQSALDAGTVHYLIDTKEPADVELLGGALDYIEVVYFGIRDNVEGKSSAVAKFLAAIDDAIEFFRTASPDDVAAALAEFPSYSTRTIEQIRADLLTVSSYYETGSDGGYISEEAWSTVLDRLKAWDVEGYDAADPSNSYDARVDMSYEKQANSL